MARASGTVGFKVDEDDYEGVEEEEFGDDGGHQSPEVETYVSTRHKAVQIRKLDFRLWLMGTTWYQSTVASRLRTLLQGKKVTIAMMLALFVALFLPDVWILCGLQSGVELDTILSMVFLLFILEAIALGAVDALYLFSFFHCLDIIGTLSIIFDISYLLGDQLSEPHMEDKSAAEWQLLLFKGMSFARVGARAGRLSRVLRIFRFLPCFANDMDHQGYSGSVGRVISNQLSNMMATQVATLTIILVMVIPMFNILSFPQNDFSLETWVGQVSSRVLADDMDGAGKELSKMAKFFARHKYGPFMACKGSSSGSEVFTCEQQLVNWVPFIEEPARQASVVLVKSDLVMVGFNMNHPIARHAGINILTMVFIICVMLFSGFFLTRTVTELAVLPLERMLGTVRQIATTVFKFSEGEDQNEDEEPEDINNASEMILLEKVVEKLATIASLQAKEEGLDATEDMEDGDLAVLGMMQGKTVTAPRMSEGPPLESKRDSHLSAASIGSSTTPKKLESPKKPMLAPQLKIEDFAANEEGFESWAFQTLTLTDDQRAKMAIYVISSFHDVEEGEGFIHTKHSYETLQKFVKACQKEYPPNPFHSFSHAVDVVHGVSKMMRMMCSELFLSELQQYTLLISALGHDLGHPGVNNGFLLETSHELAMKYNDRSPLENMHCATLYQIVKNSETNIFKMLTKDQFKEARKQTVESILHTDMVNHQAMVKELQMVYQVNSEVFAPAQRKRMSRCGTSMRMSVRASQFKTSSGTEIDVFNQPETKILTIDCILHSADVSNPCRTWETSKEWAWRCLEEFFAQGDQEKALGVPVQFLNDRDTLNRPNSQIGFIEFMIAPFFAAQIRLWPGLQDLGKNLVINVRNWEDLWVEECQPPEEEKEKVSARVLKVASSLQAAAERTPP